MSRNKRLSRRYGGAVLVILFVVAASLAQVACSDDDNVTGPVAGPFSLSFALDASFQGAHGGQSINIAVLRSSDGVMVAGGDGIVSASAGPAFTFTTGAVLENGVDYEIHYWIDSNFGVGTPGVCDDKGIDHQWRVELPAVSSDISLTESHDPSGTEDVCATFS